MTLTAIEQHLKRDIEHWLTIHPNNAQATDTLHVLNDLAELRDDLTDVRAQLAAQGAELEKLRAALTNLLRHDPGCVVSGDAGTGNPECCAYCAAKVAIGSPASEGGEK